jgi:prepilin-type N-terminal cleavage/methylation domain-containing protein
VKSTDAGFTLIEVLVALALLGLIATMLASGSRLSLSISAKAGARADSIRIERIGTEVLRNQLRGAMPYRYWISEDNKRLEQTAFIGESDRVRFIARDGILDGPEGFPRWVDIQVEEDKLVVQEHRILPPDNQPEESELARLEVTFCLSPHFDYLMSGEKTGWQRTWSASDQSGPLPFAIRISCKPGGHESPLLVPLDYAVAAQQQVSFQ